MEIVPVHIPKPNEGLPSADSLEADILALHAKEFHPRKHFITPAIRYQAQEDIEGDLTYAALQDGRYGPEFLGYMCLEPTDDALWVNAFATVPEYRRNKALRVGSTLLCAAELIARSSRHDMIRLRPESVSLSFYRTNNYAPVIPGGRVWGKSLQ
jgi:hypothetical protein